MDHITLAGVIGTGLFIGLGEMISAVGPNGTVLAYLCGRPGPRRDPSPSDPVPDS
ncbi:hypothetical protein [Rhodococcus erythropolis]|uniref:hypothetical protein n=1 Tax=Rhodococcus erythropolis TaxID=1833 RepID=UPI00366FE85C